MRPNRMLRISQLAKLRHRFVKDEKGATAVEFAMIGAPFFALIGLMLLGGHVLWISQSMDTSIQSVSRQIRTGQAQTAGMGLAQFRNAVCSNVAMSENDCRANLIVDVRRFDAPEDINFNPPRKNGSIDQEGGAFQIGDREDYVIVKVYLAVEYFSQLANLFGTGHDLDFHLSATAAFRNEPF
ncbi:TadE/TadG family type IV pilus assembly protein [Cohaesibacter gelatinilyticus]|uniref:TadE-like protein n=1 Tax=Cohaesibacter gelatinilyticus TaxID=372072 RepID=A0A285PKT6_9HYPH|nr:TadE/TadG family type IV pilus assembly protein [Cohaesibacter gelatinilyticus]SNZ20706.1 TadE-like protein [Cohaesibacter gelatinilyticus]HAT86030.1 pilus assembly protein [Hyphomicrobiales bacterium]